MSFGWSFFCNIARFFSCNTENNYNTTMTDVKRAITVAMAALAALVAAAAVTAPLAVRWEMGRNEARPGQYSSRFVIKNVSPSTLGADWQLFFNQFSRTVTLPDASPVDIDEVSTTYYRLRPNGYYTPLPPGDSLVVEMMMGGTFVNVCYAPMGGHVVLSGDDSGQVLPVDIALAPLDEPGQWRDHPAYPDGPWMYDLNATINNVGDAYTGNDYDIFPMPKQVDVEGGYTTVGNMVTLRGGNLMSNLFGGALSRPKRLLKTLLRQRGIYCASGQRTVITLKLDKNLNANPEYYALRVADGSITVTAAGEEGAINGVLTLVAAIDHSKDRRLQNALVIDYPDLRYRGFMLDVARNFITPIDCKRLVDILSYYKINTLQFHFTDDEAWRLEIPGLPELTRVGARRGHTLDEHDYLAQIFDGNGDPDDRSQSANGYFTTGEFVDFLRYAHARGISVIPEIETPGHARAAIKAMQARARQNPLERQYRLWDDGNTSAYTSAQGYHDNVLNVASPDVYLFLDKVIAELQAMYRKAGLKLEVVHLGGDEVAQGAWDRSPDVQALKQREGLKTNHEVNEYYLRRVVALLSGRRIRVEGWQEIAMDHSGQVDDLLRPHVAGVNAWQTIGDKNTVPYTLANNGYPVILSGVGNFYIDMAYSWHQYERGLHWGGKVDEFDSWSALPYNVYASVRIDHRGHVVNVADAAQGKVALEKPGNILGVQGQLWGETLRGFSQVQQYCLPKIFGLAERGWNARPAWGDDLANEQAYLDARHQYNLKIGTRELPLLHRMGYDFHLGAPGIKVENGMLYVNTQYPGEMVTYTTDGSEPTMDSPRWTPPVKLTGNPRLIKAKAFYLQHSSVTTYCWP